MRVIKPSCSLSLLGRILFESLALRLTKLKRMVFVVDKKVDMLLASDSAVSVSKSMALAQIGFFRGVRGIGA